MTEVPAEYLTSAMSEAELQRTVAEMAQRLGWRAHHTRPARTAAGWRTPIQGDAGFPDLVLAREGEVIFAELKAGRGGLAAEQLNWQVALVPRRPAFAEHRYYLWRPADLVSGRIEAVLR